MDREALILMICSDKISFIVFIFYCVDSAGMQCDSENITTIYSQEDYKIK